MRLRTTLARIWKVLSNLSVVYSLLTFLGLLSAAAGVTGLAGVIRGSSGLWVTLLVVGLLVIVAGAVGFVVGRSSRPDQPHRTGIYAPDSKQRLRDVSISGQDESIHAPQSEIDAKNLKID